jgi:hypothetical protein
MNPTLAKVLLWLLVINLGIAFGAGLYESRIVLPQWLGGSADTPNWNSALARRDNTGVNFWVYVTTGPLTLLSLANLIAGRTASGSLRHWWIAAATLVLADRLFTFSYFIPTMLKLMTDSSLSGAEATARALHWQQLNYLRHAIVLAAWLTALRTFSLLYRQGY